MVLEKIHHKQIQYYVSLRKERKARYTCNKIILTDPKTCFEAPDGIEQLIVNEGFTDNLPKYRKKMYASKSAMIKMSGMQNHPEFIGLVNKPAPKLLPNPRRIIFLDDLQNPGNVGTIIRSALAFNFDALYYTENSCDPFNDKALRAAKSAIFHLPIFKIKPSEFIKKFADFTFFQAGLEGQHLNSMCIDSKSVLILSNEGNGATNSLNIDKTSITIPMNPNVESLNVSGAANILMYHFNNQRQPKCLL